MNRRVRGVVLVTDRRQAVAPLPELVATAVRYGIRWVLLREKDLPRPDRVALADRLRRILAPVGGGLIVAGPDPLGGRAVHLASADPPATEPVGNRELLTGRSCHTPADLDRLTGEDYVTVSPVFPSLSKPGYGPPLGPEELARLCRRTSVSVLALGGVETPRRVARCLAAGAAGVAVMGAVMRDPERVGELIAAAAPIPAEVSR